MSGQSFDPGTNGPQKNNNSGSDSELVPPWRLLDKDANIFQITPQLHADFTVCLSSLRVISGNLLRDLPQNLHPVRSMLARPPEQRELNRDESWKISDAIAGIENFAAIAKAVNILETLLYSGRAIGDPFRRQLGQVPVQELVADLRTVANNCVIGGVGSSTQTPDGKKIDASLKTVFDRHAAELSHLEKNPS